MGISKEKVLGTVLNPGSWPAVGRRRLEKARDWVNRRRQFAPPPCAVTLFVTYRCNLRCPMCPLHGEFGKASTLPLGHPLRDLYFRVIDELAPYGTTFTMMGGEPMLDRSWLDLVRYVKGRGLVCDVITNGTFLAEDSEGIVESGLDIVHLSLDGLGELHDKLRGVPGTFDKVSEGIDRIVRLRKERNVDHPKIFLCYTIMPENFGTLVDFAEWAKGKGVEKIRYAHVRFFGREDYEATLRALSKIPTAHLGCMSGFIFDPGRGDTDLLVRQIRELRSQEWPFEVNVVPDHPLEDLDAYYNQEPYRRRNTDLCRAPWLSAGVNPDGKVISCKYFPCGDLHEQSFMEIWNGPLMREFRRAMWKAKRLPVCHRCCF